MNKVYTKNRKLCVLIVIICILVISYVALIASHTIEKNRISGRSGTTLNMQLETNEYRAYDVDGMTEEEIKEYLDIIRSGENEANE